MEKGVQDRLGVNFQRERTWSSIDREMYLQSAALRPLVANLNSAVVTVAQKHIDMLETHGHP